MKSSSVSLSAKMMYGIGDMPITMTMVLFGLFTLFFYSSVMGLPASLAGIGIFAGLVVDALVDPYIGYRSDNNHSTMGRRHVFMLPGALLFGPCFYLLFSPPRALGKAGLFAWLVLSWLSVRISGAIYRIPYLSLGAELSPDYDERTSIFGIRALFGLIGTVIAASLSFLWFFPAGPGGVDGKLNYDAYPRLGAVFGGAVTLAGVVCTLTTRRFRTFGNAGRESVNPRIFLQNAASSLRNRAFRQVASSFTLFFLAVVFNGSLSVYYFTWYAKTGQGQQLSGIQAAFYGGAVAGVFLWMALARRAEKRTIYVTATIALTALLCGATALIGENHLFGTGWLMPLLVGHAIAGVFASAVWVFPPSMMADVVDHDEATTGLRREGLYFGILNLGEKVAAGGALFLSGTLLQLSGALSPVRGEGPGRPPADPFAIGVLYGVVPAVILLFAVLAIRRFQLGREQVRTIQMQLSSKANAAS